jgi:hypothetical protein
MFKVYWTNKDSNLPCSAEFDDLTEVLVACEAMRKKEHTYVTMVSDYEQMTGKPGAKMSGSEYVPQMLNP